MVSGYRSDIQIQSLPPVRRDRKFHKRHAIYSEWLLMRVVAIFLTMLAVSTLVSGAQCVVRCSEPPHHAPCHHQTPSKEFPATQPPCDSLMEAGETPSARLAISPLSLGFTAWTQAPAASSLTPAPSRIAAEPWERPPDSPRAARLAVLRI